MTVRDKIIAHLAAVYVNEASFTHNCKPIDKALAERTGAAEGAAFLEMLREPCHSLADIQAKLDYVLNGTVAVRQPNLSGVLGDDGCDLLDESGPFVTFLRSLVIADVARPNFGSRSRPPHDHGGSAA